MKFVDIRYLKKNSQNPDIFALSNFFLKKMPIF